MSKALERLRRLAGKASADYRMIQPGDHLLLGVSGGKDSLVLLNVLCAIKAKSPFPFTLTTATFDPGFPGFGAGETAKYCESLGVEHHIIPFDMPALLNEKGNPESPCVLCSRMRRGCLYTLARKLGCNKLVLGQHMDDVVISFLISLSRGEGLTTMGPNVPSEDGTLRVIRPLIYARESLVAEAAAGLDFPARGECQYKEYLSENGVRAYFKDLLETMEQRIPDIRSHILHSLSDVRPEYLLDKRFLNLP
ncbi:MAG: hypothetical protein E7040_12740 [Lentisphaerae bacterium]|nr:hypothetical protein [Lentisphaerota bacterium]